MTLPRELVADAEAEVLAAAEAALVAPARRLVLDFGAVTYANSAGVGILVILVQRARERGIPVVVAAASGQPRTVLERVAFSSVAPERPTVEGALEG